MSTARFNPEVTLQQLIDNSAGNNPSIEAKKILAAMRDAIALIYVDGESQSAFIKKTAMYVGGLILALAQDDTKHYAKAKGRGVLYPPKRDHELFAAYSPKIRAENLSVNLCNDIKDQILNRSLLLTMERVGLAAIADRRLFNKSILQAQIRIVGFAQDQAEPFYPTLSQPENAGKMEKLLDYVAPLLGKDKTKAATKKLEDAPGYQNYTRDYAKLYDKQIRTRRIRAVLIVAAAIMFLPSVLVTIPLWFMAKRNEPIVKVKTTERERALAKRNKKHFWEREVNVSDTQNRQRGAAPLVKEQNIYEKKRVLDRDLKFPKPNKVIAIQGGETVRLDSDSVAGSVVTDSKTVMYCDKYQAQRFRFFATQYDDRQPRTNMTPEEMATSKDQSRAIISRLQ